MYYLYILLCSDGSLYTGITNNIEKRIATHRSGKGSKYVYSRLPVKLIYKEEYQDRSSAAKREVEIKRWKREKKIETLSLKIKEP